MSLLAKIKQAALELPEVELEVTQWHSKAKLRRLSLAERSNMFARLSGEDNKTNVASLLVAYSLVDEDGSKLHNSVGIDDIYQSLEQGAPETVEVLYQAADKLSAVTKASVEELEKN